MRHTFEQIKVLTSKMGVLVVEDDNMTRDAVQNTLKRFFDKTFGAGCVKDAVELFSKNKRHIDIILTDLALENESGFDLIEKIKKINSGKKFIIMSGYESTENFIKAIVLDVESFILKPVETNNLLFSIQKAAKKIVTEQKLKKSRQELQKAKAKAVAIAAAQDDFIKDAIHELHTPLSVIITNADLIKMEHGENIHLSSIEAACKVLQTSYEDMAYMMQKDKYIQNEQVVDLPEFLKSRVAYFDSIAIANGVKLVTDIDDNACLNGFLMSASKLQRLIDNNLSNAVKYSKRGKSIRVSLKRNESGAVLEFHNYGILISDKKKIFKRYHRENEARGGYGIGLSFVYEICKEYGIGIKVLSSLKKGNSFIYAFNCIENGTIKN